MVFIQDIRTISKNKLVFIVLIFLFTFPTIVTAQSTKEKKEIFAQAEAYFLYEEYDLANQLFIILDDDTNYNFKYKIGVCYLNIPGEKANAIPYLETAIKNASYDSKTNKYAETKAPLDAYFFLAKAYMINNEFDKGLATLEKFNELSRGEEAKGGMENLDYINQQIQACKTAIHLSENPIDISKRLLGKGFTDGSINENPAVSFDGNSIVYTEKRGMVNVIMYSRKERGEWQTPIEITSMLNAGEDCTSSSLNADGTLLFLYKTDNYDGNLYYSELAGQSWTPIKKLNRNINTKYFESHASISADGTKFYFTSNREGGQGGLDIYVSERTGDGPDSWGPAVNLGSSINTPFNEDNPFLTANDSLLYFSSEGHVSMGGYDNFKSRRSGSDWATPENLGYPINSSDDDKFFQPINNGLNGYYSMTTDYKKNDIFYITMNASSIEQLYGITGFFSLSDTIIPFVEKNYAINLIDNNTGDTVDVGYPNKISGRYSFMVSPGNYKVNFTGYGYYPYTVDTIILRDNPTSVIYINANLERDLSVELIAEPATISVPEPPVSKIDLSDIPIVDAIDESILFVDMQVSDVDDSSIEDVDILYYTVQVMALHNPVDVSYFTHITDLRVLYNDDDLFYRYTTGMFETEEEATSWRDELIKKGYPDQIFIKKVSK